MVLRPSEDDKRRNYDASTAPNGAVELGERFGHDQANLFGQERLPIEPSVLLVGVILMSSCISFDVERERRVARRICYRRNSAYRGSGSFMLAKAYPMTAIAAAFSRSSPGTILSSVSAAVWW